MAPRPHYEVTALITHDGKLGQRKNVLSAEKTATGRYLIRLPPDRAVRPETHSIVLTPVGNEGRTAQLAEGAGGNTIEIRTFEGAQPADATFLLAAERL